MESPPTDNAQSKHKIRVMKEFKRWLEKKFPPPCPPSKNLTTLPNEILSLIAACTTKKDLLAFRATSKQLHGNSVATFIVHFIHEVNIMLSRKSLQALVEISQHEVFGPHVRAVGIDPTSLCADRCTCDYLECLRRHREYSGHENDQLNTNSGSSTRPVFDDVEGARKTDSEEDVLRTHPLAKPCSYPQQQRVKASVGDDLREAFTNLAKHGRSLCLSVGDYAEKAIGYDEAITHRNNLESMSELGIIFKTLLKTAVDCELDVQQLNIEVFEDDEKVEKSGSILLTGPDIRHASAMLLRLRKIDLKLMAASLIFGPLAESCDAMARLLSASNNLEALTIDMDLEEYATCKCVDADEMQAADPLGKLARSLASSKLLELELHCIYGQEADLQELISKHAGSLKSLTLKCCCIWEGGSWRKLFSWMLENLSLQKLAVSDLMIHRGPVRENFELPPGMDFWMPEAVGEKAVKRFMRRIVREAAFQEKIE